jgi:hypothetical protein
LIGFGSRARWPIIAGVFVAAFLIPLVVLERDIWLAVIFALCDAAEPLIIAGLIARYFGYDFALDHLRKVFGLLGATIVGTAPSSLGGAVASRLFLGPEVQILTTWLHWWTGVAVGAMAVAPIVIGLSADMRDPAPRSEQIEGVAGLLALAAMTGIVLFAPTAAVGDGRARGVVVSHIVVARRPLSTCLRRRGVLIVSLTIAWTTIFGLGHFGNTGLPIDYRIAQAQAVILATAIGAQVLAALFAERRESEARLAHSNAMLERERDNRLLNAQVITAANAHEIRQPLSAMATNADAALRWLGRSPPNHDKVRAALTSIKNDGHRASEVFEGIRSLFGKSITEREPIDVNRIIFDVTDSLQEELNDHGVETYFDLMTDLPLVIGYGAQLQEAFST